MPRFRTWSDVARYVEQGYRVITAEQAEEVFGSLGYRGGDDRKGAYIIDIPETAALAASQKFTELVDAGLEDVDLFEDYEDEDEDDDPEAWED